MGMFFKALVQIVIVACCSAAIALSGCNDKSYEGEYHYNSYGTEYGVRVKVEVDDNVIKNVRIVGSDYVEVSPAQGDWTAEDVKNWTDNVNGLLKKYEGRTVDEVMALNARIESGSLSSDKSELGGMLIDGATLGSARVLLAVQDALKDLG